jgi:elongation factor P
MPVLPNLNSIKVGLVILYSGEPYIVQEAKFVRMQQRKPVMQTKLKHLVSGNTLEYSFKAGEKVETAELDRAKASYLYEDHEGAHFMDSETYEQFALETTVIGEKKKFLKESLEVIILKFNGAPISLELPPKVDFTIASAPPGVKGDSAQGRVMKEAILENGTKVKIPLFVNQGDVIRVSTDTGDYTERVEQRK